MTSLTHITMGLWMPIAMAEPTIVGLAVAISGGIVGSVLPDIDLLKTYKKNRDAALGEALAVLSIFFTVVLDLLSGRTELQGIISRPAESIVGAVMLIPLLIIGRKSDHRGFTHSLLALILFSAALGLIHPIFGTAVFFCYCMHLLLDLLNKRGIRLFFPIKKRFSFKICNADKTTNKVFMFIGLGLTILMFIVRLANPQV